MSTERASQVKQTKPSDRLIGSLLGGTLGAFAGGAFAWANHAGVGWIVAASAAGYLVTAALDWWLWTHPRLVQVGYGSTLIAYGLLVLAVCAAAPLLGAPEGGGAALAVPALPALGLIVLRALKIRGRKARDNEHRA
jgi:hypothetical protein